MNPVEMALQTWRDQKLRYCKQINLVIAQLSRPLKLIPSTQFQSKLEELKQFLKYSYTYEQDQGFNQIYVHHIAGIINLSLMELANKIVELLGGSVNFWQNKIIDIATYTNYHPQLSIWEVNRFYQPYMGLSPQFINNLRKKRSLSKNYLFCLTSLCKLIDKSKANQEDLIKIDQSYKKLKKAEEKYYAFMQQVQQASINMSQPNISTKGKNNAKNTLFMFLKNKDEKVNTLIKYNFKVIKEENQQQSKLLKGKEYEQFDQLINRLTHYTKSQRQSIYSDTSQSVFLIDYQKEKTIPIQQLKSSFKASLASNKKQTHIQKGNHQTFIWSKQYFFTYWGFLVKYKAEMNFTQPFRIYDDIIYDIDSQEEFDQLNAEDLQNEDEMSDQYSDSDAGSFVVGDDYKSDEQQDKDDLKVNQIVYQKQRWQKSGEQLKQFEVICLCQEEPYPLCLEEDLLSFDQKFIQKINGKGRSEIFSIFQDEKKDVSKSRIDSLLKNNFKKVKNKSKQIIYIRCDQAQSNDKTIDVNQQQLSDPQTTIAQNIDLTINYASKSKEKTGKTSRNSKMNQTIIEESPYNSK